MVSEIDVPFMQGRKWYSLKELRPFITGTSRYENGYPEFWKIVWTVL